jgi:hypothetical protein
MMSAEDKPKRSRKPRGESLLLELESDDEAVKKVRAKAGTRAQEELLDEILEVLALEVRHKTLKRLDPNGRTAAARLLLKRADQRRQDRHQHFLETQAKKKEPQPAPVLTEEQKQQRIKEIMGLD